MIDGKRTSYYFMKPAVAVARTAATAPPVGTFSVTCLPAEGS